MSSVSKLSNMSNFKDKIEALKENISSLNGLTLEIEKLYIESEQWKSQHDSPKEKCDSKKCPRSESLLRMVAAKDSIIQSIASALTRLQETKNWSIIDEIFKILFGESIVTPPKNSQEGCRKKKSPVDIKKELSTTLVDVSMKDETITEIEGTPTSRTSPILQSRLLKNCSLNSSSRDKKKCPDNWPTPEKKSYKVSQDTPTRSKTNSKLRQQRLQLVTVKSCNVVDLTCSPEVIASNTVINNNVQLLVKKESMENDETILPSPTSGPTCYSSLYKSGIKSSPNKFKRPLSCVKVKSEINDENKVTNVVEMEDSINILKQYPIRFVLNNNSKSVRDEVKSDDVTHCSETSMSLLNHVNKLLDTQPDKLQHSPSKLPLEENVNVVNTQDNDSSMSLLRPNVTEKTLDHIKKKELAEPVYKEPTVRKKSEKRALPGWSCDECKNFYDELYKDDPAMLAQKMDDCSKHRGKSNPARPKTPPGFWYPRWNVPEDTEEFNRRNNAT